MMQDPVRDINVEGWIWSQGRT